MPRRSSLGRQLVAGEREAGGVPAHAQPRHAAELEDRRVAVDPLLDADDVVLDGRAEVVVVPDEQVTVGGGVRPGHDVAASSVRHAGSRLVPELLDRGGEEHQGVEAGRLGDAVELLDEPGKPRLGEGSVLGSELALPLDACARPADPPATTRPRRAAGRARAPRADGRPPDASRPTTRRISMRGGASRGELPDERAERLDVGVDVAARSPVPQQVGPAPTIASQTPRFAR